MSTGHEARAPDIHEVVLAIREVAVTAELCRRRRREILEAEAPARFLSGARIDTWAKLARRVAAQVGLRGAVAGDQIEDHAAEPRRVRVEDAAVTSIPDEKKGERLAVLHTMKEPEIPAILEKLGASGLPNLFIPRPASFVRVEKLPVLGTGKLDLREILRIAMERLLGRK